MNNALALLGLLSVEPSHGYDLKHSYDRTFGGQKPLAFGQVYATLARMIRDGLIAALDAGDDPDDAAGPERKRYRVTPAGREKIAAWMFTPDTPSEKLQSDLFAKTVIALLLGDDAAALLDAQRAEHMQRMRELTRAKQGAGLADVLLIDHGLFHIEADLRWIDLTASRLGQLAGEVRGA